MSRAKLICTDLDGTLLKDDESISEENRLALKAMLDRGYPVYLVTGRPEFFAKATAKSIDTRIKVISYNGAVYDLKNEKIIKAFSQEAIQEILKQIESFNFKAYFKSQDTVFTNDSNNFFDYSHLGVETVFSLDEITNQTIVKVIVLEGDGRRSEFEDLTHILEKSFNISRYDGKGFEMSVAHASKGKALKEIMAHYDIDKENVYVFGDDMNDLSMFDAAGHAIASANANDFVKKQAAFVSTDNNNSCVANGLKHFGLLD